MKEKTDELLDEMIDTIVQEVAPKDILVFSRYEVEHWRISVNHIIALALRDGKVVYERQ